MYDTVYLIRPMDFKSILNRRAGSYILSRAACELQLEWLFSIYDFTCRHCLSIEVEIMQEENKFGRTPQGIATAVPRRELLDPPYVIDRR